MDNEITFYSNGNYLGVNLDSKKSNKRRIYEDI